MHCGQETFLPATARPHQVAVKLLQSSSDNISVSSSVIRMILCTSTNQQILKHQVQTSDMGGHRS